MTSVAELEAQRRREHRIDGSAPMSRPDEIVRFIEDVGVVMASGNSSLPKLTEAIMGSPIIGSWMAKPHGDHIYDLWVAADRLGLLSAPLVQGKQVYLRADLGDALAAVAADPGRVARAEGSLKPLEQQLYDSVRKSGEVRMDEWAQVNLVKTSPVRTARSRLTALFLVAGEELHTDRGYHTVILRPAKHPKPKLSFAAATRALLLSAIRACVLADAKEVRKWSDWTADALDAALDEGDVVALDRYVVCNELLA